MFVTGRERVAIYCRDLCPLFAVLTKSVGFNANKDYLTEREAEAEREREREREREGETLEKGRHCGKWCFFFFGAV